MFWEILTISAGGCRAAPKLAEQPTTQVSHSAIVLCTLLGNSRKLITVFAKVAKVVLFQPHSHPLSYLAASLLNIRRTF